MKFPTDGNSICAKSEEYNLKVSPSQAKKEYFNRPCKKFHICRSNGTLVMAVKLEGT